jgi:hypothetical protein
LPCCASGDYRVTAWLATLAEISVEGHGKTRVR